MRRTFPENKKKLSAFLSTRSRVFLSATTIGLCAGVAFGNSQSTAHAQACTLASNGGHLSGPGILEIGYAPSSGHTSVVLNGHFSGSTPRYTHCSHSNTF